jgi:tRNA (guanine37-N1)-methyltransferase
MHVDFITLMPDMFGPVLNTGVIGRAAVAQRFSWRAIHLRSFATGRHRITDEPPFGGGAGMVMKAPPMVNAIRWATSHGAGAPAPPLDAEAFPAPPTRVRRPGVCVAMLDPAGTPFTQAVAARYAREVDHLVLVCGRYEGVDERVKSDVDECLCVGDAVLTGGELPALMVADAVLRLLPGTLGNAESVVEESHAQGVLEYPHYTRPREFEGVEVPPVLMGGNHALVARWRRKESLVKTRALRPDVFAGLVLSPADQLLLDEADGKPPPPKKKRRKKTPA